MYGLFTLVIVSISEQMSGTFFIFNKGVWYFLAGSVRNCFHHESVERKAIA